MTKRKNRKFVVYGYFFLALRAPIEAQSITVENLALRVSTGEIRSAGGALSGLAFSATGFLVHRDRVVFLSQENLGVPDDWNGDGDTDDSLYVLYDAEADLLVPLGLATGSLRDLRITGDYGLLSVSEVGQGMTDLNGDGELFDQPVHVVDLRDQSSVEPGVQCGHDSGVVRVHRALFCV